MHITRSTEIPDFGMLSPEAKTCLVYQAERILTLFEHFGFKGTIMRLFQRHDKNGSEACPPSDMVRQITELDRINTLLKYGLETMCLPVFRINPVKLSNAFRKGIQATTDIHPVQLVNQVDMPHDYLWFRQSILAVLQHYNRNSNNMTNSIQGPFVENTDNTIADENETELYKTGFFDAVDFQRLANIPVDSLANLFRDVAKLIITAYHQFMLKRLNNRFARQGPELISLFQIPKNTVELHQVIAENQDNDWAHKLIHSASLINIANSEVPNPDRIPMKTAGKFPCLSFIIFK